jgi:hypothetical protein
MLDDHGLKDRPRDPRPEPERTWCLAQGSGDLLGAFNRALAARYHDPRFVARARAAERIGPVYSRTLFLLDGKVLGPQPAKNLRRRKRQGFKSPRMRAARSPVRQAVGLLGYMTRLSRAAERQFRAGDTWIGQVLASSQARMTEALSLAARHPIRVLYGVHAILHSQAKDAIEVTLNQLEDRVWASLVAVQTAPDEDALGEAILRSIRLSVPTERVFLDHLRALASGAPPEWAAWRFVGAIAEMQL